ncbi:thermonuclease family protein [Stanieria cyanosphaera]|uniref:thermonuclease family protein n=1 Tax=Stanieria cyanosphaera TaxID=102116 RepID=UPI0002F43556|nr:thermonuclease family protein [Stanieria cyanosphaera]
MVSGQTIEVWLTQADHFKSKETVRIIGINAPDLQQSPWGKAAQQRLKQLISPNVSASSIQLKLEKKDPFNRYLAHIWHDKTLISEQLVKEGYVLADTNYPNQYSQRLWYAQEYARLMGYGIWNPQQPMRESPEQFRSQQTKS